MDHLDTSPLGYFAQLVHFELVGPILRKVRLEFRTRLW